MDDMIRHYSETDEYHYEDGEKEYYGFKTRGYTPSEIKANNLVDKIRKVLEEYSLNGYNQEKEPTLIKKADGNIQAIIHMSRDLTAKKSR